MLEQQTKNPRIEQRGNFAEEVRQIVRDRYGDRLFLLWHLRTVDGWKWRQIERATEIPVRTIRRRVAEIDAAVETLRATFTADH